MAWEPRWSLDRGLEATVAAVVGPQRVMAQRSTTLADAGRRTQHACARSVCWASASGW
jgi:hypothetical protein